MLYTHSPLKGCLKGQRDSSGSSPNRVIPPLRVRSKHGNGKEGSLPSQMKGSKKVEKKYKKLERGKVTLLKKEGL
jgi:hypothetical protein